MPIDSLQERLSTAMACHQRGDSGAALSSLDGALAVEPNLAPAWLMRGNVLLQTGRLQECVESYRRAIVAQPIFPEAYNNLAAAQRALRQWPEALESADRALVAAARISERAE